MFCGHCGRQIPDTSRFCGYCGHPTANAHDPQPDPRPQGHQNGYQDSYQSGLQNDPRAQRYDRRYQPHGPAPRGHASPPPLMAGAGRAAVHTARNAGRYRLYAILGGVAVLALFLTVLSCTLFLRSGKPEDTVADLEKALNALDTDAMLDCFDEQTQKLYSGSLGVAGSFLDMDLGALSDLASGLGGIMAGAGLTPKFTMRVTDIDYSGKDTCLVTVDMSVSYEGDTGSEIVQLPMKKVGRKWLISMGSLGDLIYDQ